MRSLTKNLTGLFSFRGTKERDPYANIYLPPPRQASPNDPYHHPYETNSAVALPSEKHLDNSGSLPSALSLSSKYESTVPPSDYSNGSRTNPSVDHSNGSVFPRATASPTHTDFSNGSFGRALPPNDYFAYGSSAASLTPSLSFCPNMVFSGEQRSDMPTVHVPCIMARKVSDLPRELIEKIERSGIDKNHLEQEENFPILCQILRFTMKTPIQWSDQPPPPIPSITQSILPTALQCSSSKTTYLKDPSLYVKKKKFLGKGGFGLVYLGADVMTKYLVVMKQMRFETIKEKRIGKDEIDALSALDHPNIVSYYSSYIWNKTLTVVIEYIDGISLSQATKKSTFTEPFIALVVKGVLSALAHIHAQGLLHRDVKSGNIMLSQVTGQVKLIDFGLCCDEKKTNKFMVGSPFWMAPEMILGQGYSFSSDIWSLGICCLEMHEGKPPNRHSRLRCLFYYATEGVDKHLQNLLNKRLISMPLFNWVSWLCQFNPSQRPSAEEALNECASNPQPFAQFVASLYNQIRDPSSDMKDDE